MIDANSQFFAILTNVGMAKQANADALGIPWKITEMGVGDANNTDPIPNASQTTLINEWRRRPLNQLKIDPINPAVLIAEQIIPADEGGKWIREIGLYDADGDLVAVANCAPSFKPILSQGSGRTQIVRMNFIVTSTGNITLKIDPAIVLASRAYVDAAILEVLPKNKTPGEWTRVKTNDRGIVVSGDNPSTLAGMGITDAYTKAQIEAMIAQASALPVGATVAFPLDKVAPGFLELDGSVKSIAAYPDLATFLGTAFNKGDEGAGNFRLPESRGEFLRGWDHGRGADAGRGIGSYQLGQNESHNHRYFDAVSANIDPYGGTATGLVNGGAQPAATGGYLATGGGDSNQVVSAPNTVNSGGNEARPRNLAVMWCIKAWNAPINQGNIDIAALAALAAQATEINQGTAKVATDAQMLDSANDAVMATPKKLRKGFAISLAAAGYIAFPTWLGGLILQWSKTAPGNVPANGGQSVSASWPITFPNAVYLAGASCDGTGATANVVGAFVFNVGLSTVGVAATNFSGSLQSTQGTYFWGIGR
ncbi:MULTISPECIES: phage tail protein [Gammaproteobacteria]|uniref:phage tail protein n=1 Tax=Gammaproteobacteria TaxID=1236 RepID=UPI001912E906|nr:MULTISPECIES: phage tail protein [Gammaproteobacteria]MBK5299729.1 phage tail protein [Bacillus sp. TH86]MBK5319498.1 phage tail protein [Bacillus sp. TH59]MBK5334448.1 phage tail protein [Bacillus sp. TH57]MBK5313997.1 phage tail protein [Erwinia sp. TH79]MBK5418857.1 phage tail protein [Erwinia sp. TH29]